MKIREVLPRDAIPSIDEPSFGTGYFGAAAGADAGLDTALVEKGPLGGTYLNRGCNPSNMLIQAATAANHVRDAEDFFLDASLNGVDYEAIIDDIDKTLGPIAEGMAERDHEKEDLTMYEDEAVFVDETLTVRGELNKLASNMALGRNRAGIHYRTDGIEGLRLGEAAAIRFLEDQLSLPRRVAQRADSGRIQLSFETFDGEERVVTATV